MNRRNAVVALLSIPLGAFGFKRAEAASAHLSIDLNQWNGFMVQYRDEKVFVSSATIFHALCDGQDYRKNTSK